MRAVVALIATVLSGCGTSAADGDESAHGIERRDAGASAAPSSAGGATATAGSSAPDRAMPNAGGAPSAGARADADAGGARTDAGAAHAIDAGEPSSAGDAGALAPDSAASAADAALPADDGNERCLEGITDYTARGPFRFSTESFEYVRMWVPDAPADCRLPVVHFSVGTGASCMAYQAILEHLASHGFLTACSEKPAPDDGTFCANALQAVFAKHLDRASRKVGSMGHHTGGAVAISCVHRAEQAWGDALQYAGVAAEPMSGTGADADWAAHFAAVRSPFFLFNGSEDGLVSAGSVRRSYEALSSEKYWYEGTGATHVPIPDSWVQESAVVFFRWKLLGDEAAGEYFARMPDGDRWDLQERAP